MPPFIPPSHVACYTVRKLHFEKNPAFFNKENPIWDFESLSNSRYYTVRLEKLKTHPPTYFFSMHSGSNLETHNVYQGGQHIVFCTYSYPRVVISFYCLMQGYHKHAYTRLENLTDDVKLIYVTKFPTNPLHFTKKFCLTKRFALASSVTYCTVQ